MLARRRLSTGFRSARQRCLSFAPVTCSQCCAPRDFYVQFYTLLFDELALLHTIPGAVRQVEKMFFFGGGGGGGVQGE